MDFLQDLGHSALGSRLHRLSERLVSQAAAIYRERGLPFEPRWFPLCRLLDQEEEIPLCVAAQALGVSDVEVTAISLEMIKEGLVLSHPSPPTDTRAVLKLTGKGLTLVRQLEPTWNDITQAAEEMVLESGVDILATLDGLEKIMAARDLSERAAELARRRRAKQASIVPMRPEHASAYRSLYLAWLANHFTVEPVDEVLLGDPQASVVDGGGAVLIAVVRDAENHEVVVGGCALLKVADDRFELAKLVVAPEFQGQKIGEKLLRSALALASRRRAVVVELCTHSKLQEALRLYRKVGFRVTQVGRHPKYSRTNLVMECPV
jgi:ribosomal protein S18 acetylase RimI-like enzyme